MYSQIDAAIDAEASTAPEKALEWSEERYAILRDRAETETKRESPALTSYTLSAGSDLVHRYYLAGKTEQAAKILNEMNQLVKCQPNEASIWGSESSGQIWKCTPHRRSPP